MLSSVMFYYFLIYGLSHAYTYDPKYNTAVSNIDQATFKITGTESQYNQLQSAAKSKGMTIVNNTGLGPVAAVGGAVVPVILYKKATVTSGPFKFEATLQGLKAVWTLKW